MRCALSLSWVGACAEGRVVSQSPLRSTSNLQDTLSLGRGRTLRLCCSECVVGPMSGQKPVAIDFPGCLGEQRR